MTASSALADIIERLKRREQAEARHEARPPLRSVPEPAQLIRIVEALLFAAAEPLSASDLAAALPEGSDVPARVLDQTLELFRRRAVAVLAYNEQTAGAETRLVERAARAVGVPAVAFTETLPAGHDYVGWMRDNLSALRIALSSTAGASS